jgi:hypothetical protein
MIVHDISEMGQFDLHRTLGRGEFEDLLDMAKAAPDELHLFKIRAGGATISVVLAISAEVQADLERRLSDPWKQPASGLSQLTRKIDEAGVYDDQE